MTRTSLVLFMLLVAFASFTDARKLKAEATSQADMSLYLSSLPKGTVPSSTPSKKGHASITDETLITRHLIAIDRILRSVPSPGVGH
nr:precursor of CEP14-like [Tanacetum cinerariifolium]